MQRQLVLVALLASVTFSYAAKIPNSKPNSFYTPSDNPQCSSNASSAYFDLILVIDNSVNMEASNLRKIATTLSLSLSKFSIGNQIDITQGQRNVRIAVVTFDNQATIVANYSDINSVNDLTRILNGITISNTQGGNLADPVSVKNVTDLVSDIDIFDDGTPISVNFNTANQDVTSLLNLITFNPYVNASMYNLTGSSSTLTRDLEWAMLQDNLFDFPYGGGIKDVKDLGGKNYPFYLGLHKNNNSQWTWWNYDLTEFPASYLNWAPGHPQAGDNCAIADSNDGQHLVWKSRTCDPSSGLGVSLCQGPACDATTTICCAHCNYCELHPNCGIFPKKKLIKKRSKKDRLIRKMAKVNGRMVRVD
uniref:C-type lectin n=1 Tax=Acrobeloides nanus TaxID=290746 RepID=A0A914E4R4_9BILA